MSSSKKKDYPTIGDWASADAAFHTYEEVGVKKGRSRLEGAGKLTPTRAFTFRGKTYTPGQTRCAPTEEAVQAFGGTRFKACLPNEIDERVERALKRGGVTRTVRRAKSYLGTLPPRRRDTTKKESWRLGK